MRPFSREKEHWFLGALTSGDAVRLAGSDTTHTWELGENVMFAGRSSVSLWLGMLQVALKSGFSSDFISLEHVTETSFFPSGSS